MKGSVRDLMRGMLFGWENCCVSERFSERHTERIDDKLGRQYT